MVPYHGVQLIIIHNLTLFQQRSRISSILTQLVLVSAPPDWNYAHEFLEFCGLRFWILAECQYHVSYVNPNKIQIYYTFKLIENHTDNWAFYKRRSDGIYQPIREWERMIQSMFSIYPLLIYTSFNHTTVMFKYMIFPELKERKISEQIPICNDTFNTAQQVPISIDGYTGEWTVVLNRFGVVRREIMNANELVDGLLKTFENNRECQRNY